jgi:glucosamine--fructose-6-phosphate aminotransferase (isomerizing)
MCGIVGYIGPKNSVDAVLKGLERLEYRGYDSAGISIVNEKNGLEIFKKSGKLENLKNFLADQKLHAKACIGHTRWATHGRVNDTNSHPHDDGEIAIVHNGIIENAEEIKSDLIKKGFKFLSETDSEVFVRLLSYHRKSGKSLFEAIGLAFSQIRGNSAFVILDRNTADIYALKRGAPLVCGINSVDSQALVSSDPYALIGYADKLFFPEDGVVCHLSVGNKNLINFTELDGKESKRYLSRRQDMLVDPADKGEFEHFMLKEIYEQPGLIRALIQFYFNGEGSEYLTRISDFRPEVVNISACGTAFYAGMMIRDYFEYLAKIPSRVELASELRYREPLFGKKDLGLFISQSGETADTLAAQQLLKSSGLKTYSIVNIEGSTLFRDCNENLLIRAGIEIGVASTKAFTQQSLTGRLLVMGMNGDLKNANSKKALIEKFNLLADRIDSILERLPQIKQIAQAVYNKQGFFYTGRGIYYPIALEGALKLKEISYVHAEGYAAGELKHGPIALIDEEKVNVALVGAELYEKTLSNIQEIKARRGIILTIGLSTEEIKSISDYHFGVNLDGLDELSPIALNVVNQLLAYEIAKLKGTDIDKPRNLAKSVTVE